MKKALLHGLFVVEVGIEVGDLEEVGVEVVNLDGMGTGMG